jgi:hypothetical protein
MRDVVAVDLIGWESGWGTLDKAIVRTAIRRLVRVAGGRGAVRQAAFSAIDVAAVDLGTDAPCWV